MQSGKLVQQRENGGICWNCEDGTPGPHQINNPWIKRDDDDDDDEDSIPINRNQFEVESHLHCVICKAVLTEADRNHVNLNPYNNEHASTEDAAFKQVSLAYKLLQNFILYCETTTLRGVPKILKTREPCRRFMWTAFVFILFAGCITCLYFIITQYTQYDVIHQPVALDHKPLDFPSISICNLRPFSTRGTDIVENNGLLSFNEFQYHIEENIKRNIPNWESTLSLKSSSFTSLNNYLLNLPENISPHSLGHELKQMVYKCGLTYQSGSFNDATSCDEIGKWISVENEFFQNCFTYNINKSHTTKALTLVIVAYLDNPEVECFDCQSYEFSQMNGVRLVLHTGGTWGDVLADGTNLMPGTMTEIRFKHREWKMLTPPHGGCRENDEPTHVSFNGNSYKYSYTACLKREIQIKLNETCHCILNYDIPDALVDNERKICNYLEFPTKKDMVMPNLTLSKIKEFSEMTDCLRKVQSQDIEKGLCPKQCIFYTYDTTTSSAKWPTESYKKVFLDGVKIKYNHTKNKEPLRRLNERIKKLAGKSQSEMSTFFDNNFLTIQISRNNFAITEVNEKAVVSLTSLLSQVGGLLSIWIGLTFICVVELVEFFMNIIQTISQHRF